MLKTVLETTEGLDEAVANLYTETDGKFILAIDGVDAHPDVANLKSAYERVKADRDLIKTERDTLKSQNASLPDDFDLAKWEKLKDGKPDEAALIALRQELEAERDEWRGKYESASETARSNAIARDLTQSLTAAGVIDEGLMRGATAILAPAVKVGEDGAAIVDTDMGPLPLGEHVKRWVAGDGKAYVDPGKGGGGKGGEGGGKPSTPLMDKVPQLADLPEK